MNVIFLRIHIVTCIFIIEIVRVLLNFTRKNLYIGGFWSMLRTHVVLGFNERPYSHVMHMVGHVILMVGHVLDMLGYVPFMYFWV